MKKQEFTLSDIISITDRLNYLIGIKMPFGTQYKIGQFLKPFAEKNTDILKNRDEIIKGYLEEGETEVKDPIKVAKLRTELHTFLTTTDSVEVCEFKLEWIETLEVENCGVLFQFFD